jgi:hypothetical protein
VLQAYS